jgi:hypothetical protein
MDLAQMDKLASENNGVKYLLVCVDVLSRFVRIEPMKDKTAIATKEAFMKMMTAEVQPKRVWVDEGREYEGRFKTFCKDMTITVYHTNSSKKAAFAERAIRSLKNIIYRYNEDTDSLRYIHKLQSFAKIINSRVNRSIGMAPKDVSNWDALKIIHSADITSQPHVFHIGDYVRAVIADQPFRKGYKPQFSREIFKIKKILSINPPTYKLEDKRKTHLKGRFYEKQLIHYVV